MPLFRRNSDVEGPASHTEQKKQKKISRSRLPVKRTINFAAVSVKRIRWYVALPLILLILAGSAVFSRYAVINRFIEVDRASSEVAALRRELEASYRELTQYGEMDEQYAHYTYSDMTEEELTRIDRVMVVEMLESVLSGDVRADSWTLSGNTVTINVTAASLQGINRLAQSFQLKSLVEFCSVNTAQRADVGEQVSAVLVLSLKYNEMEENAG